MSLYRRQFLTVMGATAAVATLPGASRPEPQDIPRPPEGRSILLSCKLGMVRIKGASLEQKFAAVKEAGFDGIDADQVGDLTPDQVRNAVRATGLFVHNAINHAHWRVRHTSADAAERADALEKLKHCLRVSHAAGGSGALLVIGRSSDGPEGADRARVNISKAIPLAASLGQMILFENVWNGMFYTDDGPADQKVDELRDYIDSFKSPWIGCYFDIGNHARYCNPADWIRALGTRVVKLDLKGYDSRKADKRKGFCDITKGNIDWADVRKAVKEIGFHGWATAEVRGGGPERLAEVLSHMKKALLG